MKRLREFLRSVAPEDLWQLVYLVGAVFLYLSPRLGWSFGVLKASPYYLPLALTPVVIAGIFAYYGCFQPGARPLRRIALAVFLPALLGFAVLIGESSFFNEKNQSVFVHRLGLSELLDECALAFHEHPSGFSLALIALVALGIFAIRMYLGISSLPLRLGGSKPSRDEPSAPWNNVQVLIFVLLCPLFLLERFLAILFSVPSWWWYHTRVSGFSVYLVVIEAAHALVLVFLAILITGRSGRESARSSMQLPAPSFAFFGLMLPILISLTISSSQFLYDRAQWAATGFGRTSPPHFAGYFLFGEGWHWSLVLLISAAFAEEIIFRGFFLRALLRRYGSHRAIFFVGLIWAAFHFHGEMRFSYSIAQALLQLASRIAICSAMNYVLSWMTLRSNSVIPAGIAHTVSNVLVMSGINSGIPSAHGMRILLWAVWAIILFRYWPPQGEGGGEVAVPVANPGLVNLT